MLTYLPWMAWRGLQTREKKTSKMDKSGFTEEQLLQQQQELFKSSVEKYNQAGSAEPWGHDGVAKLIRMGHQRSRQWWSIGNSGVMWNERKYECKGSSCFGEGANAHLLVRCVTISYGHLMAAFWWRKKGSAYTGADMKMYKLGYDFMYFYLSTSCGAAFNPPFLFVNQKISLYLCYETILIFTRQPPQASDYKSHNIERRHNIHMSDALTPRASSPQ